MKRTKMLPRIPPRFRPMALTDRGTGEVWALMCAPADEHLRIVSPLPAGFSGDTYQAYYGPTMPSKNGVVTLFVRDGRLGFEVSRNRVNSRPVLAPERTRVNYKNEIYQLFFQQGLVERRGTVGYYTEVTQYG